MLVPLPKPTFFKFSSLPAELRTTIWLLAVPRQDRLVKSPTFRPIKHAPCLLFLVCKEAKACAETQYQLLQRHNKGCNLLMGTLVPSIDANGLPISLDHRSLWTLWFSILMLTTSSIPRELLHSSFRKLHANRLEIIKQLRIY